MFDLQRHAQAARTCCLHAAQIGVRAPHPCLAGGGVGGGGGGGAGANPWWKQSWSGSLLVTPNTSVCS